MLYKICLLQIFVYLFASPFLRSGLGINTIPYSFEIALLFILFFIAGGIASNTKKSFAGSIDNIRLINPQGTIILTLWAILYSILSLNHGLANRRIGTHEAAVWFSEIPVFDLIAFRIFELLLPFIIAHLIIKKIKFKLNIIDKALAFSLVVALILSGLIFSRSQTFYLLASSAIILQNSFSRQQFNKILVPLAITAAIAFIIVTFYRVTFNPADGFIDYFSDEILKRVDGLELISLLIDSHGYPFAGVNPSAVAPSIISSIPFLPATVELKALALTTVKSNILALEFGSMQGDTNSFIITDVYYWGGVAGLIMSALFLGSAAKKVDQGVMISRSKVMNSLFLALACNVIYLEREFVTILIGTARDFAIYSAIFFLFCRRIQARSATLIN